MDFLCHAATNLVPYDLASQTIVGIVRRRRHSSDCLAAGPKTTIPRHWDFLEYLRNSHQELLLLLSLETTVSRWGLLF